MPRQKHIDPVAIEHLQEVIGDKSIAEFVRSINRVGWGTTYQSVQKYLKGENEIQPAFAREVARVYGVNASWLLNLSPHKTPTDESLARVGEYRTRKERKRLLFDLMTSMRGWVVDDIQYAAPYGESESKGLPIRMTISKGDKTHAFNDVDYDKFIGKMLDFCDFELSHM